MDQSHYGRALSDVCSGYEAFKAPNRVTISEGAAKNLIIKQTGGAATAWSASATPYMVAPLNSLASRLHEATVFVGPARTGKTAGLLVGWMCHNVVNDPGNMLFIQMNKDKAREFSKTDIDSALRHSEHVKAMLSARDVDDNTFDKMFRHGMWVRIAWPTVSNVSGSTYRYVAITDIDRMANAENVDGEGPLFDLAKKRTTTFMSRGMTLVESSPGKPLISLGWTPATAHEAPPTGGILSLYNRTDRQRWYWRCPECGSYFEAAPGLDLFRMPSFEELVRDARSISAPVMAKHYARITCPVHGCIIQPSAKKEMNSRGVWLPDGVTVDDEGNMHGESRQSTMQGYWLGGVAAAYQSWQSLIEQYLIGLQEFALTGSEEKLKQTVNTDQGMPYMPRHLADNKTNGKTPAERAEEYPQYIAPAETRCIIAAVDVQGGSNARFVVQIQAVGPYGERWVIDRFEIKDSRRPGSGQEFAPIDPAGFAEDWDQITELVIRATWRTPEDERELHPLMTVVDTGGEGKANGGEGVSHNAYAWYRRLRAEKLHNRVMLYKGGSEPKAPVVRETMVGGKNNKTGDVPLQLCNPHLLSDAVDSGLRRDVPGPGYIHFPKAKHPTLWPNGWVTVAFFDELHAETRSPSGIWSKVRSRNETFDLCRMAHAGYLYLGLDKIVDWNKVPPQLSPLYCNSLVVSRADRRALQANTREEPTEVRVLRPAQRKKRRHAQANLG